MAFEWKRQISLNCNQSMSKRRIIHYLQFVILKITHILAVGIILIFGFAGRLGCLFSGKSLNSTFSASYIKITITFDVLGQCQENKVFQTAQTMNNILRSNTEW